jgi:hypothetical protein
MFESPFQYPIAAEPLEASGEAASYNYCIREKIIAIYVSTLQKIECIKGI